MAMTDRDRRLSPLAVLGDGILLLCALLGLTLSFLSLYGGGGPIPPGAAAPLDKCAAGADGFLLWAALFALAALSACSLPRFWGAAAGGLAAVWGLFLFFHWEEVFLGGAVTVRAVTVVFAQRVSWGQVLPYDPGLTPVQAEGAARLFLLTALAGLALLLGWAVVRARRWWLALAFTLPPLLPGLLADLYPDWPAFMALALCWCAMLLTDLCKWAAPDRRGQLTLAVLPCVGLVLALITFAFPREGYTRPQWALEAQGELQAAGDRLSEFLSQFDGPFQSTITYVGTAEEADLAHAGPLNYTGRTVLRVSSDYGGRMYLRGSSLAGYEGGVWRGMTDEVFQEAYRDVPPKVLFFPAMSTGYGPEYTVTVDSVAADSCVYAPYFLAVQDLKDGGMTMVNDSFLARRQGRRYCTLSFVELPEPHPSTWLGEGTIVFTDGLQEGAAVPTVRLGDADFGRYPQFVHEHYLDVPEDIREDLAQFCISGGIYGAGYGELADPVETAQQIAALLDELCEYDVGASAAPEGVDPVLWFLDYSRRGYCMHYASAATLMLRTLGIPARYVSGYTVQSIPGRRVAVPDRAAHAWVEVWVGGFGWYPVEVTPAAFQQYEEGDAAPGDLPSLPPEESEEPEDTPEPSQAPSAAPSGQPSAPPEEPDAPGGGPDLTPLFSALKVLSAIAGAAALLWLAQFLPKRFRAARLSAPDRNRAALYAYRCLRRMERWGGRMDERAVELAQKARFSQHTLSAEELAELRALVDRERGRLCVVLGPVERLVFRYLWGMPRRPRPADGGPPPEKPG